MAVEIEKKFRLTAKESGAIEKRLEATEAVYKGERFERNVLYSNAELDKERGLVRLREIGDFCVLTFKRPMASQNGLKTQLEFETGVDSFSESEKIIEHIGLEKRLIYEKRRKIWEYFYAEVVLDELPFGFFLEIEGTGEQIAIVERALGLAEFPTELSTYPGLTAKYGNPEGDTIVSRF